MYLSNVDLIETCFSDIIHKFFNNFKIIETIITKLAKI